MIISIKSEYKRRIRVIWWNRADKEDDKEAVKGLADRFLLENSSDTSAFKSEVN